MEWVDGFPANAAHFRRNANSEKRYLEGTAPNRFCDSFDAPACSPARWASPEPPTPLAVTSPGDRGLSHTSLRLAPATFLVLIPSELPVGGGEVRFPRPSTHCYSPPPAQTKRPLPRVLPHASVDRSHRPIPFHPRGFAPPRQLSPLRSRGLIASRTRPGVRRVARCSHLHRSGWVHLRVSRDAISLRRTPLTDVRTLSPGPFPPCRQLRARAAR